MREIKPINRALALRNKRALLTKKAVPCADCGLEWHPAAMTLDHLDRATKKVRKGKKVQPSEMILVEPKEFDEMLDVCEAVCSNCHKVREMRRDGLLAGNWSEWSLRLDRGALLKGL